MKFLVRLSCLLLIPAISWSQTLQYASATRSLDTNGARTLTLAERETIPFFGEQRKTSEQIDKEIRFLSDCDKMFTNREEASNFFAARAWEYVQEGQLDTAAYRFNLAYLLNEKNVDAYWGLGVVSYQKNQLEEAASILRRGVELAPNNVPLMVDLSTIELRNYTQTAKPEDLEESYRILKHAASLDSTYSLTFFNLATVEYYRADYPKAWEALHTGRRLNFPQVDFEFVNLLRTKLPDPEGFFK
ncbi:tetratricopeptide repeat protein [Salmonirosea aquatica]|uniref:Tetratricopeptide repeat protein n=1 Tax=Salmonirosea aquatica TaxID=2654236 RepID=A0A7C9BJ12_9BACT|nr:tetratricopeptide repeat protein [Cytophagaceae bacterium SJW1-29]